MGEVWEGGDSRWTAALLSRSPGNSSQVPEGVSPYRSRYEVSKDGKRFLVFTQTNKTTPTGITTVRNWTAGLKR